MKLSRRINLFMNASSHSLHIRDQLLPLFEPLGYQFSRLYDPTADLNLVIGGDGTFLRAVRDSHFSPLPFLGINTGHLGFFQEISPDHLQELLAALQERKGQIEKLALLQAHVHTSSWDHHLLAVNEFFVTARDHHVLTFHIACDDVSLIDQAADGVILSTPSGSSAHNLSAGGSLLYQTLQGYQLTTISPIRSKRYRSLPASIVVPSQTKTRLCFDASDCHRVELITDGIAQQFHGLDFIEISQASQGIQRLVFDPQWYWKNIKEKFL